MHNSSRSSVLLKGEKSLTFNVKQGVIQDSSLSTMLFFVFIGYLLNEINTTRVGIQLISGTKVDGILFANDSVSITESS